MENESTEDSPLAEIIIRKSMQRFLLHAIISIFGLALVIYIWVTERLGLSMLPILFVIIFVAFALLALRGLSDRSIQVKMDQHSISFKDGTTLKWSEIIHASIERKSISIGIRLGRGTETDLERYFLNLETIFSGQVTGYRTAKSIEITGLEYTPGQILHLIEQFKRKYR